MESTRAGTEKQNRVNIDKEEICAYGRVRYLLENNNNAAFKVTTSFYNAIKRITAQGWSPSWLAIFHFWTNGEWYVIVFSFSKKPTRSFFQHILVQADVETRKISRSCLSYTETYEYLKNKVSHVIFNYTNYSYSYMTM